MIKESPHKTFLCVEYFSTEEYRSVYLVQFFSQNQKLLCCIFNFPLKCDWRKMYHSPESLRQELYGKNI